MRINLMGTGAGLGVGLLLVALAFYLDSTMRSEADLLGALDLPVLVLLPLVTTGADRRRQRRRERLRAAAVVLVCAATGVLGWVLQLWKYVV
jgi:ferric-dicitrate binding protein FerR (iron transport regulator)